MKHEVYSLTFLKGICATLVVLIHTHMIGKVALIPFYRCAVPLFFMVSGYFLMGGGEWRREKIGRYVKKVLLIWAMADIVYFLFTQFVFTEYKVIHNSTDLFYTLGMEVVFGGQFCYPLWYVTSYIWVLVILRFWRCRRSKFNFCIIVLLLLANVLLGTYRFLLPFDITNKPYISDNFLTSALPFVMLGGFLKPYIQTTINKRFMSVTLWGCLFILCYAELAFLYFMDSREGGVFLTTPILSAFIFILLASHPDLGKGSRISMIGKKYSLNIYLFHVLVIWTVNACSKRIGINIRDYEFIVVLPITVLICHILGRLKNLVK